MQYADVIVDITLTKLDRTFQYLVPEHLSGKVAVGSRVTVPFGKGGRTLSGFVLGLSGIPKVETDRIREILSVEEGGGETRLIALAAWIAEHYGSPMNQALRTVFPSRKNAVKKISRTVRLSCSERKAEAYLIDLKSRARHSRTKEQLLSALLETKELSWEILTGQMEIPSQNIRDLEKKGIVSVEETREYRNPIGKLSPSAKRVTLNEEQEAAVRTVREDRAKGLRRTYLLYGVTGSGKTEVYITLIRDVITAGKDAIVLIPEISLTYQTVLRFYREFGDLVSVVNSRMSSGERADQMDRAKTGSCRIMIGPRSAVFTPFQNLGLIIVDEEHEPSYKSGQAPRYHAREVAIRRGEIENAPVLLGSATPSVESFRHAKEGEFTLLTMKKRVEGRPLPEVEVVDLRKELREGNRSILSRRLQELLADRLKREEQSMLFLNRRGLMGFVSCRSCGKSVRCPHCDVSLSLHRDGRLHCHYCGYTAPMMKVCPSCGSPYIGGFRAGTEMVERTLHERFPEARILRMDADTTRTKDGYQKILERFRNREADILVGTQMIVKGHDFPGVTLMGVLAADMSLNSSDFRGSERTFDLLTQAAGRAGRGSLPGNVVIQTYQPEQYSIQAAAKQNYEGFYSQEISYRKLMDYPPCGHLLEILLTGGDRERLKRESEKLASFLREDGTLHVLGPEDDRIAKLRDVWRRTIYLKDRKYDKLIEARKRVSSYVKEGKLWRGANVWFDFDPE